MGLVVALQSMLGAVVGEPLRCSRYCYGVIAAAVGSRVTLAPAPMSPPILVSLFLHPVLEVVKKLLLGPDDRSRAADAAQRDRLRGDVPVVLHHV